MIQVIHRALKILRFVADSPETPCNLGDIAAKVELNAATCARILKTLVAEGYIEQMGHKKGYVLGPMSYSLGGSRTFRRDLALASEHVLRNLSAEINETVMITAMNHTRRLVLLQIDSNRDIQVRSSLSQVYDPYASATGRMLIAFLPDKDRAILIKSIGLPNACTWPRINNEPDLQAALSQIRKQQITIRKTASVTGIAFPVFAGVNVTGALGCFLPSSRFTGAHKKKMLCALEQSGREISRNLS